MSSVGQADHHVLPSQRPDEVFGYRGEGEPVVLLVLDDYGGVGDYGWEGGIGRF